MEPWNARSRMRQDDCPEQPMSDSPWDCFQLRSAHRAPLPNPWQGQEFEDEAAHFSQYYTAYLKQPVFERLTDTRFYSGSHRERFDSCGYGRGLAGREYVYLHDGSTESQHRKHEVYSTVARQSSPRARSRELGRARGVDAIDKTAAKLIVVYRNGDGFHEGDRVFVQHHMRSLDHLYRKLMQSLSSPGGRISELYDQHLRKVASVDEIVDGGKYLACEGRGPTRLRSRLQKFLTPGT
mmetsp:Transcript_52837/g.115951  ORF Transcript_52837/g.115951 Transcript_52837/m.115951 type:complete len:238 (-) Transcript_52837:127-840(-)